MLLLRMENARHEKIQKSKGEKESPKTGKRTNVATLKVFVPGRSFHSVHSYIRT